MASSTDFLVDDAYRNVWCSPEQDRQHIVAPARISKRQGEIGSIKIGMRSYNLPSVGEWYHCYVIGDLPPVLVGMDTIVDKWVSVRGQCVATSLLIDIYTNSGLHFPTSRAYFLYTRLGNLVIAIKDSKLIDNLGVTQPFIRWRSNAWFDSDNVPINGGIEIEGITPKSETEFYPFQVKWKNAKQGQGYAWAFVNGKRVKDLNLTTLRIGDHLEYIRDASVKEVLEIPVKDLLTFDSVLDNKGKYLLPRPGLGTTIDYSDDIDIYLLNYRLAAAYSGYYYHCNQPDAIRNVTHRDLSVPTAYLRGYVEADDAWTWFDDLRVEVIVRNSGWVRKLVDEAHRIKELFKLPEDARLKAMIGPKSIDVWSAANLENSPYIALMRAEQWTITRDMVEQAYGYNALSRLIGDTPFRLATAGQKWIELPYGLTAKSTVYEYDTTGKMVGWWIHDNSIEYPIRDKSTRYIEAYAGHGGVGLSTEFDKVNTVLKTGVDYRFYISDIFNGVHQNNWRDVTGDATKYMVGTTGEVTWLIDTTLFSTAVRNSVDFLSYTFDLDYRDDLLAFTLNATEVRQGRVPATGILDIPFGQVDIWLNDWGLVPNVDYYVNFPEYCIVNKAFLNDGPVQKITVRGRGFCNSDMSVRPPKDWGFVAYGMLSHNSRFNIRDDKVSRIVIGGALYTRDEVGFSEDGTLLTPAVANGLPYMITHPIVPMMGLTNTDTYTLLEEAEVIDQIVEDYLTLGLPEPTQPLLNPIPASWKVFSPYTTKLIYDMLNGILPMDEFMDVYTDEFVRQRLVGYEWILQYDPAVIGVDEQYVVIHPHPGSVPIELNIYQYRLLDHAVRLLLGGKVALNRSLVVVEDGFQYVQP